MGLSFGVNFLICNVVISVLTAAIALAKKLLNKHLSPRVQYNIWFLLLIMLTVPFLPIRPLDFGQLIYRLSGFDVYSGQIQGAASQALTTAGRKTTAGIIQDFVISVNREAPSFLNTILIAIWLTGIVVVLGFTIYSYLKIKQIRRSALPVQNQEVQKIFKNCKQDMGIRKAIPLYSSAYLKSPFTSGLVNPMIFIPIHLISDCNTKDIRHILLHELEHFKSKDILVNYVICLIRILYWFNPLIWYAVKEMHNDREIACDASVLHLLDEENYADYGYTLIKIAKKDSVLSFSSAAGINGTNKQIKKRILSIASYRKETKWLKVKSVFIFLIIGALLLGCSPALSVNAFTDDNYRFSGSSPDYEDLSSYFEGYNGSFVLYDLNADQWNIYNESGSTTRVSPNSTYKIYSALFGLEAGSISPDASALPWDGIYYPYDTWNQNHTLDSAIENSVNWYFQKVDEKTGMPVLQEYIDMAGYGNQDLSGGISSFWMESSLKISPVEQVELLISFCQNDFQFEEQNIQAVKDAMLLSTSGNAVLYGKTGTGNREGQNTNGWFIGFVETDDNTYFFAANISADDNASGSMTSKITLAILEIKNIYPLQ